MFFFFMKLAEQNMSFLIKSCAKSCGNIKGKHFSWLDVMCSRETITQFTQTLLKLILNLLCQGIMIKKFHAEFQSIANAFQTFLRCLFVKKSLIFTMTSRCFFSFFQGSLKEKQSLESLIVQENHRIFLSDMSA